MIRSVRQRLHLRRVPTTMAVRRTTNKSHNKKLRRRREGLSTKAYEYGELKGAQVALFISYPERGTFYSYLSQQHLPWIHDVEHMVASTPASKQARARPR